MQLTDFLAPFDAAQFRAEYYGRRPVYMPAQGRRQLDLLPWQRFNEVLELTPYWQEDSLKVFFKSRAALRENYCDVQDLAPGQKAPVNPAKVKALLGLGASLVANHLHRVCPPVNAVAHMLEHEFAARVFANVYCSFRDVQAFQTHYDLHDVFACQAEGEKTWRVYEARADAPVNPLPPGDEVEKWLVSSRGKLLFEVVMKPGDLLYLPRGQYHDALTGAQASLHVTFGVAPATGLALFKVLEKLLEGDSGFRAYLPDARHGPELGERLARLAARVHTVMTTPAFLEDVRHLQQEQARRTVQYGLPAQVVPAWYSVARPAQVLRRDSGYVLAHQGGELPLAAGFSAVNWLLQQRVFSVQDVLAKEPGADPAQLQALLQQLTQAGIIVATDMR